MSSSTPLAARVPFRSAGLQVHCYTAPASKGAQGYHEYGAVVEQLTWHTSIPGGYNECSFRVTLPPQSMLQIPPELDMFSRVQITRGADVRFIGEIDDSQRWMQNKQEYIQIHALGLGNALRDDAASYTYTGQTLQAIAQDQLNSRTGTGVSMGNGTQNALIGVIDADTSQLFPDNPAGTWAPAYDEKTIEEVFQDITTFGSTNSTIYMWGTEAHPTNKDARGFATCRVWIRKRDVTTTHFIANISTGEIDQYNFGHNAQYAYNYVWIDYNATTSGVQAAAASDGRILTGGTNPAQGFAPFRYRKLARDYTGIITVGSSQASSLGSTYVAEYSTPSNKGTVRLRAVRDGAGNGIPLDALQAGKNILIPELSSPQNAIFPDLTLSYFPWNYNPTLAVVPIPGVNQFYIVDSQWQEDKQGPFVTLQLDNFADRAANLVAKLMLSADIRARSTKSGTFVFGPGIPDTVTGGGTSVTTAAGQTVSWAFTWHAQMARAPSSTTTSTISLVNGVAASEFVNNLSVYGGNIGVNSTAIGAVTYLARITSHGNTLLAVDGVGNTIDWHCDHCGTVQTAAPMASILSIFAGLLTDLNIGKPGTSAVRVTCPVCGSCEHFNTALTQADTSVAGAHGQQATQILALLATPYVTQIIATQVAAAPPPV